MLSVTAIGSLFVTGGTGFVGRHLLAALSDDNRARTTCLTRDKPRSSAAGRDVRFVEGDLTDVGTYADALRGAEAVVHLAAQTGKASRAELTRVNVEGTRLLVEACRRAGVPRFVYVSSIAATYQHREAAHYAQSKAEAEAAVRAGGIPYVIVRPTIVLGAGSPVWKGLAALARLPVLPIFGNGRARTQPVDVHDVASTMLAIVERGRFDGRAIDIGGPEVVTIEDLLMRIRRSLRGGEALIAHIPARPAIRLLALIEPVLRPVLPVTAGQLSVFVNDSTAHSEPDFELARPKVTLDEMIRASAGHGR
jgi:nucleoside-diphosphate-sugar epimerase